MSSLFDSTAPKFFRPNDVGSIQRNQRRINVQRATRIGRNVSLAAALLAIGAWAYHRSQSDIRFAVESIEISGATHTSRAELDAATSRYIGMNLFKINIAALQRDVGSLPWVKRIEIEKKLPNTLRVRVVERTPSALVQSGSSLRYADENGVAFASLTPSVGDPDLPVVVATDPTDIQRCVQLVRDLHQRDPLLYSRISEVRPIAPHAFALFDRDLGTVLYADAENLSAKWRTLYAIANAEHFKRSDIQYADLRFADRIVLKPIQPIVSSGVAIVPSQTAEITN